MNMPLFKQTFQEFASSKTNWVGMLILIGGSYVYFTGDITFEQWMLVTANGAGYMGIKDAVAGLVKK